MPYEGQGTHELDTLPVELPSLALEAFCLRNYIRKLSLFGSILTSRFRPASDVDMLVKFVQEHEPGYLGLAAMEMESSDLIGRKVDLRTPGEISRYLRDGVLAWAAIQYERG